jgi:hypothetical protein
MGIVNAFDQKWPKIHAICIIKNSLKGVKMTQNLSKAFWNTY